MTNTTVATIAARTGAARTAKDRAADNAAQPLSRLDQLVTLLSQPEGASLVDMTTATGWQPHSVRGALAGALKKKGHSIVSQKADGVRRYRIAVSA